MEMTTLAANIASAVETTAAAGGIGFTPENLMETAPIMGKGMLGIFIVMGIVIACVSALNNFSGPKKNKEKKQ